MNGFFVVGNIAQDATVKETANGVKLATFTVADSKRIPNSREKEVSFFEFTLWGARVETLSPYLQKGRKVVVYATAKQERWEKDGIKRSAIRFVARDIELIGHGNNSEYNGEGISGGIFSNSSNGAPSADAGEPSVPF